ncbi:AP-3 complex subunit beta-2 [Nowakowskiella sp. JEL0078]|nr:AP-3 complex subunit beta-2 [Nowakowskiella sp. JEL0078]
MLKDNSTAVLGSVIASLNEVCPDRLDLIHKHFRKLCRTLPEADEWSQIEVLGILLRYSKQQFLNPNLSLTTENSETQQNPEITLSQPAPFVSKPSLKTKSFYSDDEDDIPTFASIQTSSTSVIAHQIDFLDPDHSLLLQSASTLLSSRNSMVILSVARLYFILAPIHQLNRVVKPLMRLLRSSREERFILLLNLVTFSILLITCCVSALGRRGRYRKKQTISRQNTYPGTH